MGVKDFRMIRQIKQKLVAVFKIVDIGLISFYFGLKVNQNYEKKTLKLFQLAYINKILIKFYFNQVIISNTLIKKVLLTTNKGKKAITTK